MFGRKSKRFTDQEALIVLDRYYLLGHSKQSIAKDSGCCSATIFAVIEGRYSYKSTKDKWRLTNPNAEHRPTRERVGPARVVTPDTAQRILHEYHAQGVSAPLIAMKYDLSSTTIYRITRGEDAYKEPLKEYRKNNKLRKFERGRRISDRGALEILACYHERGLSQERIARRFKVSRATIRSVLLGKGCYADAHNRYVDTLPSDGFDGVA